MGGISNQSPAVLKKSTGAANVGRGGSTVDDDLTELENSASQNTAALNELQSELMRRVNPLAQAVRIALTAAGSLSNGIRALNNVNLNPGKGGYTFFIRCRQSDWTTGVKRLVNKYLDANSRFGMGLDSNNKFYSHAFVGGDTIFNSISADVPPLDDGEFHFLASAVTRETALAAGNSHFNIDGVGFDDVAIPAAETVSIDNAGDLFAHGYNISRDAGDVIEWGFYNRALSEADLLRLFRHGPAPEDLGASQESAVAGSVLNGTSGRALNTFSSDETSFTGVQPGGSVSFRHAAFALNFYSGCKYRVTGSFEKTGSGSDLRVCLTSSLSDTTTRSNFVEFTGASGDFDVELTATSSQSGCVSFVMDIGNASDVTINVTDIKITRIGLTAWWSASDCQGDTGQVLGRCNGVHSLLPAAGAKVIGAPVARRCSVRSVHSWSGTSEAQYISLVNQAVLPLNAYIDRVLVVAEGTPVDGRLGDSVDNDRFCTLEENTGLAVGMNDLALNRRTTDGTNGKLLWTPSASGTYTLKFTVEYIIPEV